MAEKKSTPKKTVKKDDKVSVEELKKKKEEVLARINAEIGDVEEVVAEEMKEDEADVESDAEKNETSEKKDFEKEMLKDEPKDNNEVESESVRDLVENKQIDEEPYDEEVSKEKNDETVEIDEDKIKSSVDDAVRTKEEEIASTFSAAEFGLAERRGNKGKNIILFTVVFLLVALISALFYFFYTGALKFEPSEKSEEVTTAPTETPSPTPTPVEFNRADLSVQVLNGSGVSGAAGEMETYLEDLGYENIEVGNAENSDYLDITIQIREEFEEFAESISEDLSSDYRVNEDYELLDDDSDFDVIIIVGSEEEASDETDE